ncbi:MAG: hypothetical protein IPH13_14370 [Planctomycetes bacterium]|nr:hypothetical protein [Planctomycetota bacterium]MCC7170157.1 hypothetical protein [Planctomycetota bacterium]
MSETVFTCEGVSFQHGAATITLPAVKVDVGSTLAIRFETIDQAHLAARLIVGFDVPTHGTITLFRKNTSTTPRGDALRARRRLGYAAAQPAFLSTVPLPENVAIPLRDRSPRGEDDVLRESTAFLAKLGVVFEGRVLPQQASPAIRYLSGVARALAPDPLFAVVEEPPAVLTAAQSTTLRAVLDERSRKPDAAMILLVADTLAGGKLSCPCVDAMVRHQ